MSGVLAFPRSLFQAIPPEKMSVGQIAGTVGLVAATPLVLLTWLSISPLLSLTAIVDSAVKGITGKGIAEHDRASKKTRRSTAFSEHPRTAVYGEYTPANSEPAKSEQPQGILRKKTQSEGAGEKKRVEFTPNPKDFKIIP